MGVRSSIVNRYFVALVEQLDLVDNRGSMRIELGILTQLRIHVSYAA